MPNGLKLNPVGKAAQGGAEGLDGSHTFQLLLELSSDRIPRASDGAAAICKIMKQRAVIPATCFIVLSSLRSLLSYVRVEFCNFIGMKSIKKLLGVYHLVNGPMNSKDVKAHCVKQERQLRDKADDYGQSAAVE
jgi:hypothetical protein